MKKEVLLLFLLLIFCTSFLTAVEESVSNKGYACLESEVAGECSSLSTEEKIFSLLAIDRCKTEVVEDSLDDECWPKSDCAIKTTAQAILALNLIGTNTAKAENWLTSQTTNPDDVNWLLQIDSTNPTSCTISYKGDTYTISINEDKKISGNDGTCLDGYGDDYWLEIAPSCYDKEFNISCDETFSTTLLFKKKDSDTVYVSTSLKSALSPGKTTEKIDSLCFKQGGVCNYEGTLWAARVLKFRGRDISSYLPYLITMAEENQNFLPESFLYSLTNNYKDELLLKQKEDKYWLASGDRFYDTAVALFSLQNEEPEEKRDAKAWLEEVQGTDGCWQENIGKTAFILFSAWPKKSLVVDDPTTDCGEANYHCMSDAACVEAGGEVLTDYTGCFTDICCDRPKLLESCSVQEGEECESGETCPGGIMKEAIGTELCCVGGTCTTPSQEETPECEQQNGTCRTFCLDDEEVISSLSCPSPKSCCKVKTGIGNKWIWIFGALIILTLIGIIFRKNLRKFLFKIKSKFKKGKGPRKPRGPRGFPPGPSSAITQRQTQRRILPPRQRPVRRSPVRKPTGEIDNVLKKLKEMGK